MDIVAKIMVEFVSILAEVSVGKKQIGQGRPSEHGLAMIIGEYL